MSGYLTDGDRDQIQYRNDQAAKCDDYAATARANGDTAKADKLDNDASIWRAAANSVRPL